MLSIRTEIAACLAICLSVLTQVPVLAQEAKPVAVARVKEAAVKAGQRFVGTVRPIRTSVIGSAIEGRVKDLLVNEGQRVKRGQKLAQLRTETLKIEQAAAKAELNLYIHRLAELQNGSRAEDIAEADSNMRRAKAALTYAERQRLRITQLAKEQATSITELDLAKERAEEAKFALKATEALLKRLKEGPRTETIAQAKAQVELQRQRLSLIEDRIAKSTISAPFDGFVSEKHTEVGAWISRGDPVVQVIQLDVVKIRAPVTAQSIIGLKKGDVIRVEFPELPTQLLTGQIEGIVPLSTTRARTFPILVRLKNQFQNGRPMLMGGMRARVLLPAGRRESLPLVPKDALVLNGSERSVFVVEAPDVPLGAKGQGTVRKVSVSLGVAVGGYIQVRGQIKVGDLIVVSGNERLTPDSRVAFIRKTEDPKKQKTPSGN